MKTFSKDYKAQILEILNAPVNVAFLDKFTNQFIWADVVGFVYNSDSDSVYFVDEYGYRRTCTFHLSYLPDLALLYYIYKKYVDGSLIRKALLSSSSFIFDC